MELKKGGAAQRAFLSFRGRSSLQRKDVQQGTGRKPQKRKDPVHKKSLGTQSWGDWDRLSEKIRCDGWLREEQGKDGLEKKTYE